MKKLVAFFLILCLMLSCSAAFADHVQARLNQRIATRTGLHCAPNAHKTLQTYPQGTVRFSFGHFNTMDEVLYASNAVKKILNEKQQLEAAL